MSQLLYIFDPLCGWCYGFSPVVQKIKKEYHELLPVIPLCGGLAIGDNAVPVRKMAGYISSALGQVERMTGVRFGDGFTNGILKDDKYVYDSEPPCIAMTVVKELAPEYALSFAHDIQSAFFYDGKKPDDVETYLFFIDTYGIDGNLFLKKFYRDEAKHKTYEEFNYCRDIGVTGYPALILRDDSSLIMLARGYQPYERIASVIDDTLKEKNQ